MSSDCEDDECFAQGRQGPIGVQGQDAQNGPQGYVGSQGLVESGAQGDIGIQGIVSQGPEGFQGQQGPISELDLQGFQGLPGLSGPDEKQDGPQGSLGDRGPQGKIVPGTQGPQGLEGVNGRGFQGPLGFQGASEVGPQGFQGTASVNMVTHYPVPKQLYDGVAGVAEPGTLPAPGKVINVLLSPGSYYVRFGGSLKMNPSVGFGDQMNFMLFQDTDPISSTFRTFDDNQGIHQVVQVQTIVTIGPGPQTIAVGITSSQDCVYQLFMPMFFYIRVA